MTFLKKTSNALIRIRFFGPGNGLLPLATNVVPVFGVDFQSRPTKTFHFGTDGN